LLDPLVRFAPFLGCSVAGGTIKLSDYRGKVVWLYKWRCG